MRLLTRFGAALVFALVTQSCTGSVGPSSGDKPNVTPGGGGAAGTDPGVGAGQGGNGPGAGPDGGPTGAGGSDPANPALVSTPTIARLSKLQWANSVRDLLQLTNPNPADLTLPTGDAVVRLDNEADSLFVNQGLHDDLESAAERLAGQVAADATALARLVPANAPTDVVGKATAFIQAFGRRAYRRPLTPDEVQSYLALFNQGPTLTTGLTAFAAGVRVTVEAFLQSPNFLYRTSFGGAAVQGRARLSDYEIAANLSYALTNTLPDGPLSTLANQGGLKAAAAIGAQATRLLATPAGKTAVDTFYFQFFGLGQYDTLEKSPAIAPQFTNLVGPQVHSETQQFLQYLFSQKGTLRDIFTSPVSFVNSTVAGLYGLPGTFTATTWTQVQFDPAVRPGILTRLGFLSYYGHDGSIQDSIHRGVYINRRLLCKDLSPPPGIVLPTIPVAGANQTNRQIVNGITGPGTCGASCHGTFINPSGFAFENFDGLGTYHTTENGVTIDASGTYPFTEGAKSYANQAEFSKVLAESQQLHSCHAIGWTADLYARIPRAADATAASVVAQRSLTQNITSADLIVALITNDAFVTRVEGP